MEVFPASITRFILQRLKIDKKERPFFPFLLVVPKFEFIFAPA